MYLLSIVVLGVGATVMLWTWNRGTDSFGLFQSTARVNAGFWAVLMCALALGGWIIFKHAIKGLTRTLTVVWLLIYAAISIGFVAGIAKFRGLDVLNVSEEVTLSAFWVAFTIGIAGSGWLLSSQVTKYWLRVFVGLALVTCMLLLVTIGRNSRVGEAQSTLHAKARPLLASWSDDDSAQARRAKQTLTTALATDEQARVGLDDEQATEGGGQALEEWRENPDQARVLVESALLARMCNGGDRADSDKLNSRAGREMLAALEVGGPDDGGQGDGDPTAGRCRQVWRSNPIGFKGALRLDCLSGWTVAAIDVWLDEASIDRRVAALTALTSCEARTVNPAAQAAVENPPVIVEPLAQDDGERAEAGSTDEVGQRVQPQSGGPTLAGGLSRTDQTVLAQQGTVPEPSEERSAPVASADGATAAVLEALIVQRSEIRLHDAIAQGADEILGLVSGPTNFAEFRFSGAAWLILLGAALLWYRQLEMRAGAHRLGPVDVRYDTLDRPPKKKGTDQDEKAENDEDASTSRSPVSAAEAVFKESVVRNVPEPGAIPGSEALAPVGDLVAQSDVPHKWLVGQAIEALRTVLATQGGYTVMFTSRQSGKNTIVFVRLRSTRTGRHVTSHVVEDPNAETAAREAGYWVAGWIISRSTYVPGWATWSEDDARALMRLKWSRGTSLELGSGKPTDPETIDPSAVNSLALAQRAYARQIFTKRCREVAWNNPATGSSDPPVTDDDSLHRSGRAIDDQAQDVGGDDDGRRNHLGALEDFARAVHRQERYPVARYRRGAVLGTMMHRGGTLRSAVGDPSWGHGDPRALPDAAKLKYLFGDMIVADSVTRRSHTRDLVDDWAKQMVEHDDCELPRLMRTEMLRITAEWSNRNRIAVRWGWIARLRPSERHFWKQFGEGTLHQDWVWLLKSDLCICAERLRADAIRQGDRPRRSRPSPADGESSASEPGTSLRERWRAWRRRWYDWRLDHLEQGVTARAMQPDSHWQISYNLACLSSIRSERPAAGGEYPRVALEWLERCLDRQASSQLVREWAVADGDLEPLHGTAEFARWTDRLPPVWSSQTMPGAEENQPQPQDPATDNPGETKSAQPNRVHGQSLLSRARTAVVSRL